MTDYSQVFWNSLGGSAVGVGAVGGLFTFWFNRSLERLKKQLQLDLIRGSLFHTKRAEKACEIFASANYNVRAINTFYSLNLQKVVVEKPTSEIIAEIKQAELNATEKGSDFLNTYLINSLYFEPDIIEALEKFHQECFSVWCAIKGHTYQNSERYQEVINNARDSMRNARMVLEDKFKPLIK